MAYFFQTVRSGNGRLLVTADGQSIISRRSLKKVTPGLYVDTSGNRARFLRTCRSYPIGTFFGADTLVPTHRGLASFYKTGTIFPLSCEPLCDSDRPSEEMVAEWNSYRESVGL